MDIRRTKVQFDLGQVVFPWYRYGAEIVVYKPVVRLTVTRLEMKTPPKISCADGTYVFLYSFV